MGQVGLGIAEELGWPCAIVAKDVQARTAHSRAARAGRRLRDREDVPLPAVVTVSNELGDPRYPKLQQIMQAARKTVTTWTPGRPRPRTRPRSAPRGSRLQARSCSSRRRGATCRSWPATRPAEQAQALATALRDAQDHLAARRECAVEGETGAARKGVADGTGCPRCRRTRRRRLHAATAELLGLATRSSPTAASVNVTLLGSARRCGGSHGLRGGRRRAPASGDARYDEFRSDQWLAAVEAALDQAQPAVVLIAQSMVGRDLGPRLAFRRNTAAAMDCLRVEMTGDGPARDALRVRRQRAGDLLVRDVAGSGDRAREVAGARSRRAPARAARRSALPARGRLPHRDRRAARPRSARACRSRTPRSSSPAAAGSARPRASSSSRSWRMRSARTRRRSARRVLRATSAGTRRASRSGSPARS